MISLLFYIVLIIFGIPMGIFLAVLCKDELRVWKWRFLIIIDVAIVLSLILFFSDFIYRIPVVVSLLFVIVVSSVIVWKTK